MSFNKTIVNHNYIDHNTIPYKTFSIAMGLSVCVYVYVGIGVSNNEIKRDPKNP